MIKVRCCSHPTSMKKYQENFCLVELNTTFYRYLENKSFPRITGTVGLESAKKVMERTRYPVTKSVLLRKLG
ncbi:MAG: hypothetical protein OEY39_04710 [Candidatus Bathyarchaeota archaeon]|nr:hypothetical protein [Candidatus Bathyarchaeota archaeon]MDH5636348.1 hypothetical protein [Candidatus Bathyarchaeota archaeon]MDH5702292.1 hypothetical protein [Candidatus Bathyarchaeota archaeon]